MTMNLNQAGVAVDGLLNRSAEMRPKLQVLPRGVELKPRALKLVARPVRRTEASTATVRGLIPNVGADNAESTLLVALITGAVVALGMGAWSALSFTGAWDAFVRLVSGFLA